MSFLHTLLALVMAPVLAIAAFFTPAHPAQQTAAVVAATNTPTSQARTTSGTTTSVVSTTPAPQPTIIEKTTILTVPSNKYVTHDELTAQLNQLHQQFTVATTPQTSFTPQNIAAGGNPDNPYAGQSRITNLTNVTVSGVSGITASDLPDLSSTYLSVLDTGAAKATLGLSYATTTSIINQTHIASWGDSLTAGTSGNIPYPTQLAQASGYTVYNGGVGGQTSVQIEARMIADTSKYSWPTIIWAGRNDGCSISTVESNIALMVNALQSVGNNNYLILGVINGTTEGSGTGAYTCITNLNSYLATTYGSHFVDVRSYLVSKYDPNQAQDVTDHANDTPPTSLRSSGDTLHLNSQGYYWVVQDIMQNFSLLQPADATSVLTPSNILSLFANPPTIGSTTPGAAFFSRLAMGTTTNYSMLTLDANNSASASAITFSGLPQSTNTLISLKNAVTNLGWSMKSTGGSQEILQVTDPYSTNVFQINTGSSTNPSFYNPTGTTIPFGFGTSTVGSNSTSMVAISAGSHNSGSTPLLTFVDLGVSPPPIIGVRTASGNAGWTITASGGSDEFFNVTNSGVITTQIYTGSNAFNSYWKPQSSSSKFGFGTTTPYARLSVWGSDSASSTLAFNIVNSASSTVFAVFNGGNAQLSGTLTQSSDQRLKKDIASLDASSSLAAIKSLNPVMYNWIDPDKLGPIQYGFIAQDVEKVFPNLVSVSPATPLTPDGTLGINYIGILAPLVKAVQALAQQLTDMAQNFVSAHITVTTLDVDTANIATANIQNAVVQKLCVGGVCITQDELRALLDKEGVTSSSAAATITATTSAASDTQVSSDMTASTTPDTSSDTSSSNTASSTPAVSNPEPTSDATSTATTTSS